MTPEQRPEVVQVEQGDRETAARIYNLLGFGPCQHIIDGIEDDIGVVQIVAAHRIAAEKAAIERAAQIADGKVAEFADAENAGSDEAEEAWHGGMAHAAKRIAAAIRALL